MTKFYHENARRTTSFAVWKKTSDRLRDSCNDCCIRMWHNENSVHTHNHLKGSKILAPPFLGAKINTHLAVSYQSPHGRVPRFDPQGSRKFLHGN